MACRRNSPGAPHQLQDLAAGLPEGRTSSPARQRSFPAACSRAAALDIPRQWKSALESQPCWFVSLCVPWPEYAAVVVAAARRARRLPSLCCLTAGMESSSLAAQAAYRSLSSITCLRNCSPFGPGREGSG